jgi:DNA-binding LacI/PurR family transcriptional regulator
MKHRKQATMQDIAELAGVSLSTVSRSLRDSPLVKPEVKALIQALAEKQGYSVNLNARKLRQKRSNTIAVVLDFQSFPRSRLSDPFMFQLLADVANALGSRDKDLLLCSPSVEKKHAYQSILNSKGADGIIFLGHGERYDYFKALAKTGAPFVAWGATSDSESYCCIGSDNYRGGQLVAEHFSLLKSPRSLFVGLGGQHIEMQQRWEGFRDSLRSRHLDSDVQRIILPDLSFESAERAFNTWLQTASLPNAIFAATDLVALAILSVLKRQDIKVPSAVSVVGFDDIALASYGAPTLSTIRQNTQLAGEELVNAVLSAIDGRAPKSKIIPVELIMRET